MPALFAALLRLMSTFDPSVADADDDEEDTPWGMAVRGHSAAAAACVAAATHAALSPPPPAPAGAPA